MTDSFTVLVGKRPGLVSTADQHACLGVRYHRPVGSQCVRSIEVVCGGEGSPNAGWIACTAVARVSAVVRCCTGDSAAIPLLTVLPLTPLPLRPVLFVFVSSSSSPHPHFRLVFKPGRFSSSFFLSFLLSFFFASLSIAIRLSSSSLQFYTHHGLHRWTGKTRTDNLTTRPQKETIANGHLRPSTAK